MRSTTMRLCPCGRRMELPERKPQGTLLGQASCPSSYVTDSVIDPVLLVIGRHCFAQYYFSQMAHIHDIIPLRGYGRTDRLLVKQDPAGCFHAAITSQPSVRDSSSQSTSRRDKH